MESTTIDNDINAIKEVRELFNKRTSNLSREETKRSREKLRKYEAIYKFLKEKEQKDSLTNRGKRVSKNTDMYIKNLKKYFKKYSKRFRKHNTTDDLDYLFNELNEPIINNDINEINEVRELFNEHRSSLNREERNGIREKLNNFSKEDSLTNEQKNSLKNLKKHLKKHSKRFRKHNTTYELDYLFNELNEPTINKDINAIKEVRELFNENRSRLNHKERNRIRKKLHKKEKKDSFTNNEKKVLKNI